MSLSLAVPEYSESWTLYNGAKVLPLGVEALALEISRMILFTLPCIYVLDYLKYSTQILLIRSTTTNVLLGFALMHFVELPLDESLLDFSDDKQFTGKLLRGSKDNVKMAVMSAFGTSTISTNSLGHRIITFMNGIALCADSKGLVIQALATLQEYYASSGFVNFPMDQLKERGLVPMLFLLPQFSQQDIDLMNSTTTHQRSESPKPVCSLLGDKEALAREIIDLSIYIGSMITSRWTFNCMPPIVCDVAPEVILSQDKITTFVATLFLCKKELDAAQILKIIEARCKLSGSELSKLWRFYLRRLKKSMPYCMLLESYQKNDVPVISKESKLFKFLNEK